MENKNKFDSFYIDSFDLMVLKGIETYNDCIANEDIFNPLPVSIQQNYDRNDFWNFESNNDCIN